MLQGTYYINILLRKVSAHWTRQYQSWSEMNIVKHLTCAFELKNIQWLVSADNSSCTGVRSYKKRLIWDRKKEMEIGSVLSYEHNKLHFLFTFSGFGGRDDRRFLVLLFMEKKIKECQLEKKKIRKKLVPLTFLSAYVTVSPDEQNKSQNTEEETWWKGSKRI